MLVRRLSNTWLLPGTTMIVAFLTFSACLTGSSKTDLMNCPVGSEGCACTPGNSCDANLLCLSGRCVSSVVGAAGAAAGAAGAFGGVGPTSDASLGSGGTRIVGGVGGGAGTFEGTGGTLTIPPPMDAGRPKGDGQLGSGCAADGDCGRGLICLKPTDPALGFPNGLCTADCTVSSAVCTPLGGLCVSLDGSATAKSYCLESCEPGPPLLGSVKCHNRPEVACSPLNDTVAGCVPSCGSNAQCGGRKCDPGLGVCVDQVTPGSPVGASCMANAATDSCNGFCRPLPGTMPVQGGPPVPGRCSAFCTFGALQACGFPAAACLQPAADGFDFGDIGYCYQLCDTIADCSIRATNWVCDRDPVVVGAFGRGACLFEPPQ
jgi:hypothetical protein